MIRPKVKIHKGKFDTIFDVLVVTLILTSVIFILFYYNALPDKIPLYFNFPTKVDGMGAKNLIWVSPILCFIIGFGIYKLNQFPWIFNYNKNITIDNAEKEYVKATRLLQIINLMIAFTGLILTLLSIYGAIGKLGEIENYIASIFFAIWLGIPTILIIYHLLTNKVM